MLTSEYKFRFFYKIVGRLKFLSHKELMRVIVRAFRRAQISLAYSHGYHPHPLLSFGPSLPVGMAGLSELFDVRLTKDWSTSQLEKKFSSCLPLGMELVKIKKIPLKERSINATVVSADYEIEWPKETDGPGDFNASILLRDKIIIKRKTGKGIKEIDLRPGIYEIRWEPPNLEMQLAFSSTMYVRPSEVLSIITGWTDDTIKSISITRTGLKSNSFAEKTGLL